MHSIALKWAIAACVSFSLAGAEELPKQRAAKTGPAISVRPLKRVFFEDNLNSTPGDGVIPATFAFLRSGETNNAVTIYFFLAGTAELEADYTRVIFNELENPAVTSGTVQSLFFAPGQRIQYAHFKIIVDELRERTEYIRVKIPEPIQNGIVPPEYHVGARSCATIFISNLKRCDRVVPTPGGGQACLGRRPVLPRTFFTAPRCTDELPSFPSAQ